MERRDFLRLSGWTAISMAASGSILGCAAGGRDKSSSGNLPRSLRKRFSEIGGMKLYWGDLHNHCNLTYGHGSIEDAMEAAKQQLDFCTITPHAMWPDIPGMEDPRLDWVIDYHNEAFRRLREGGWERYVEFMRKADVPESFLTFLSYECHSMEHGDHVALCRDFDTPLLECTSVPDLKEKLRPYAAYVTPHHMGYMTGFRGYNWAAFQDGDMQTPFVEMFSRHGLAESDMGDYDYLHDMGPRIYEGSVQYGLEQGHVFGLMCSTDQHAGYPGSYGDGRVGVLAASLERGAIWEALGSRHICGVTGDKIKTDFSINGAVMGDIIEGNRRDIYMGIEAQNFIDYADIVKNGECIARINAPFTASLPDSGTVRAKVKIDFGWNRETEYVHWTGRIKLSEGRIRDFQTCFRGAAFTSPQPGETEFHTRVNRVLAHDESSIALDMYSTKNPNTMTPAQQGIILDVEMPVGALITAEFNDREFSHSLAELSKGSRAHFMRGWLSEAIQFERAVPENAFLAACHVEDRSPSRERDYYYARVRQRDGQWAWSSPIWVGRS